MPGNNGEERTRQDIIAHAESANISRVLTSVQLALCKVTPDVSNMTFHVKQEYVNRPAARASCDGVASFAMRPVWAHEACYVQGERHPL